MQQPRTAIITAAGQGIGAAIARELATHGYFVAMMSNSGGAELLAEELGGIGITGSVTEVNDLKLLVDQTMKARGRIDAVVNNTGHAPKGPLLELTDEDWYFGLDLLLLNVIRMTRLVTPIMQRQGEGSIVNVSTFAVFEPDSLFPISSSIRAALASFCKLYADQYAADGLRMNNILPGFVNSYPESTELMGRIPMQRYARVEEIAKTTHFLLSEAANYITGQNIRVDGGLTRSV